jgi:hypothetical protein
LSARARDDLAVENDPVTPAEIRGSLFVIGDIADHLKAIRDLLECADGEDEDDG